MGNRKILGVFVLVWVITSVLKLLGLSLQPVTDGYVRVATSIMKWLVPTIFSGEYPLGVKTLTIVIPLVFMVTLILFVSEKVRYYKTNQSSLSTSSKEN